jgi:bifunctional pyridoxal-dependent enzyme with beta-cystathionase and maltose regulon repressor activities
MSILLGNKKTEKEITKLFKNNAGEISTIFGAKNVVFGKSYYNVAKEWLAKNLQKLTKNRPMYKNKFF